MTSCIANMAKYATCIVWYITTGCFPQCQEVKEDLDKDMYKDKKVVEGTIGETDDKPQMQHNAMKKPSNCKVCTKYFPKVSGKKAQRCNKCLTAAHRCCKCGTVGHRGNSCEQFKKAEDKIYAADL